MVLVPLKIPKRILVDGEDLVFEISEEYFSL
jgi:hypothetical protein